MPNFISFLRLPLALLFIKQSMMIRVFSIVCAMITDGLDGFIARKFNQSSRFGTLLDPLMDRFFVLTVVIVFVLEGELNAFEVVALACRDIAVILFGFYLVFTGKLTKYRFRAIWCGKMTTFLQFIAFLMMTLGYYVPTSFFFIFYALGGLALVELYLSKETPDHNPNPS